MLTGREESGSLLGILPAMHASPSRRATCTALVAIALVAAVVVVPSTPAAAAGGPFSCQPGLYQVISGQLKLLNPITGVYTDIGSTGPTYNAMGYNVLDDYLYAMGTQAGVNQSRLLRIASDGSTTDLGVPTGLPVASYVSGDMDDQGNLVVRANATTLYRIDVDATPPAATQLTLTSGTVEGSDLVWIDGTTYSATNSTLYRVNLATATATNVTVSGLPSGGYGAAWSDQPDNLYLSNNGTGVISQVTGFTGASPTAVARVTATVTSNNDGAACKQAADPFLGPEAADDTYGATIGTPLVVSIGSGVLDNDTGTGLTVTSNTSPSHGTVTVNADGSFTYTPDPGYLGSDSFTYVATDQFGRPTNTATVNLTVSLPAAPVADDDTYSATGGSTLVVPASSGVLVGDTGTSITVTTNTNPVNGTVVVNADGSLTYEPDPGYTGPDSFSYTICDSYSQCDTATVDITVEPPPAPVADDDAYSVLADSTLIVPISSGVLIADTGVAITVTTNSAPSHGSATLNPNGSFTYTPNSLFHGEDSFTYTICDRYGQCDTATVNLTVTLPPPPTANGGRYTAPGGGNALAVGAGSGVLTGISGAGVTLTSFTQPTRGRVVVAADGSFTYTPDPSFVGTDTFSYTVTDRYGRSATATVQVVVAAAAAAPTTTTTPAVPAGATAAPLGAPVTPPGPGALALTGTGTPSLAMLGAALVLLGVVLIRIRGRRRVQGGWCSMT